MSLSSCPEVSVFAFHSPHHPVSIHSLTSKADPKTRTGEPGDALAGLAAMTKDNHDLLSIEIAKHVTAFLHTVRADTRELETSPANCSPFEAEACPGEKARMFHAVICCACCIQYAALL